MGKVAFLCLKFAYKKFHLPILLMSLLFTFPHMEKILLHVDPLWMNLTGIKIFHTKQPHLLKNEILSSQQELDRWL